MKAFEQMPLVFSEDARDCGESPILVRLVEFGRANTCRMKCITQHFEASLVANRQVDITGVVIGGATKLISVFNGGVAGLNRLLREREIAARDGVKVSLEVLQLHFNLLQNWDPF